VCPSMQKKVCRITLLTVGPACGRTRYEARVQARGPPNRLRLIIISWRS
jgi:hypothetical protein